MRVEDKNMELMKTLDDAWNSQDWDTFKVRHADNVAVLPNRLSRCKSAITAKFRLATVVAATSWAFVNLLRLLK